MVTNIYTALNNTKLLNIQSDYIIIKFSLHKDKKRIMTNMMIDSGVTEDFIDKIFYIQHQFPVRRLR